MNLDLNICMELNVIQWIRAYRGELFIDGKTLYNVQNIIWI